MKCPHCGEGNFNWAKQCDHCHQFLIASPATTSDSPSVDQKRSEDPFSRIVPNDVTDLTATPLITTTPAEWIHALKSKAIFGASVVGAFVANTILDQAAEFLNVALLTRVVIVALLWWLAGHLVRVQSRPMVPAIATQGVEVIQFALAVSPGDPRALVGVALTCALVWLAIRPGMSIVGCLILFQFTAAAWNVYQLSWPSIQEANNEVFGNVALAGVISQLLLRAASVILLILGLAMYRSRTSVPAPASAASHAYMEPTRR
jgi:hypothetical protein